MPIEPADTRNLLDFSLNQAQIAANLREQLATPIAIQPLIETDPRPTTPQSFTQETEEEIENRLANELRTLEYIRIESSLLESVVPETIAAQDPQQAYNSRKQTIVVFGTLQIDIFI